MVKRADIRWDPLSVASERSREQQIGEILNCGVGCAGILMDKMGEVSQGAQQLYEITAVLRVAGFRCQIIPGKSSLKN